MHVVAKRPRSPLASATMGVFSDSAGGGLAGRDVVTIVGPKAHFKGTVMVRGSLHVKGEVEGNISQTRAVVVSREGRVQGDIRAEHVVVEGSVAGDITATGVLKLIAGARMTGNIRTPKLLIEEGAVFEGHCAMGSERTAEAAVAPSGAS